MSVDIYNKIKEFNGKSNDTQIYTYIGLNIYADVYVILLMG